MFIGLMIYVNSLVVVMCEVSKERYKKQGTRKLAVTYRIKLISLKSDRYWRGEIISLKTEKCLQNYTNDHARLNIIWVTIQ